MSNTRPLGGDDVDAFIKASQTRKPTVRERKDFLDLLAKRHRFTMRRLQADVRWLLRQADKHGVDREELRWMLW